MSSMHDVFKDDDVNGCIVGGDYMCGVLKYEGRPQGKQIYAKDESELKTKALNLKQSILAYCGEAHIYIYPNDGAWALDILP